MLLLLLFFCGRREEWRHLLVKLNDDKGEGESMAGARRNETFFLSRDVFQFSGFSRISLTVMLSIILLSLMKK